jgi:hypothetical protein
MFYNIRSLITDFTRARHWYVNGLLECTPRRHTLFFKYCLTLILVPNPSVTTYLFCCGFLTITVCAHLATAALRERQWERELRGCRHSGLSLESVIAGTSRLWSKILDWEVIQHEVCLSFTVLPSAWNIGSHSITYPWIEVFRLHAPLSCRRSCRMR